MDLQLDNKNCVVIGGSRGIGRAIALGLAAEKANVAICGRNPESLQEAESELARTGVKALSQTCDVSQPSQLENFLTSVKDTFGSIDVLVHNASAIAVGPTLDDWEASIGVDLMAAVRASEQVIPWMEESGSGTILFVSSISGIEASPAPDFGYTAAKAALIAHAKKLAVMVAPRGIRVNAIAPGSTEFPGGVWDQVKQNAPPIYESVRASIPWGRLATPEEIADVAVFLVSPRAAWVAGECVSVDGAQHRGIR